MAANYFYILLHSKRGEKGLAYLTKRGITGETIKKFGLGYADIYQDDLYRFLKSKGFSDEELKILHWSLLTRPEEAVTNSGTGSCFRFRMSTAVS